MEKCVFVNEIGSKLFERHESDSTILGLSQLTTVEDWKKYQQQIIRSCFDCWEEDDGSQLETDEKISLINNKSKTDREIKNELLKFCESNQVCSNSVDESLKSSTTAVVMDKRKNFPKRKSKRFSFYKYTRRLIREKKPISWSSTQETEPSFSTQSSYAQNGTLQCRCSAEDLWKCKKWFDSIEKIPNLPPPRLGLRPGYPFVCPSPAVSVARHERLAKRRVRKFIDHINLDRPLVVSSRNRLRSTETLGTSDKFKRFFRNVFRKNRTNLDPQLLAQSIEYASQELKKWYSLLQCLEDIKHNTESTNKIIATTSTNDDSIKYKFSEIVSNNNGKTKDNETGDDKNYCGNVETRFSDNVDRLNGNERLEIINWSTGQRGLRQTIQRSLSDTDLPAMALDYERAFGTKIVRISRKTLMPEEDRNPEYLIDDEHGDGRRDGVALGLWKEHRECFRTAVARLEFVGSTFKEQYRLTGLKALCKVDVLAGFGRSAEAVDLFVSLLPLSKNPDLMVRKAEAVYDWKFFCHLCMWRHSYKD
ncbi:uncharacterized protein LOC126898589 [Daktulosphaira vitifoliae]|uniref:uncharacterized protein LOC126898589 n=1 Tax=Daktulosphaira vitifoliae TaxID=58002 RepID=UPI0021AAC2B3|nr:uncharacterized protein LOC126898589 [Daktulosphaira vitifoliae]